MSVRHSHLLKNYIISYFSIALIACAVLGLSLFYVAAGQLSRTINEGLQNDLTSAAIDLERQYEIMQDIAYNISTTIYYRSIYIDGGVSRQLRMLEDLAKYNGYTPIVDSYFFYRIGDPLIWKPDAANSYDTYIRNVLQLQDTEKFSQMLGSLGQDKATIFPINASRLALLFPIYIDATKNDRHDAVVGFLISNQTLNRRLSDISGNQMNRQVFVYYHDVLMFTGQKTPSPLTNELSFSDSGQLVLDNSFIGVRSPDGIFSLVMNVEEGDMHARLGYFRTSSILVIIVSLLLLVVLGYLIARYNYRPIGELAVKYGMTGEDENEIKRIDSAMQKALEQSRLSKSRIDEQMTILRMQKDMLIQQFLLLVLRGEQQAGISGQAQELGIDFSGSYFSVFVVTQPGMDQEQVDALFKLINDLSDHAMSLNCVRLMLPDSFAIVVNVADLSQLAEVHELLEALGGAEGMALQITQGKVCEDLKGLPASLASALWANRADDMPDQDHTINGDQIVATQILAALRMNEPEQAHDLLDQYMHELKQRKLSFMYQYYLLADLLVTLMKSIGDVNAPILKQQASAVLLSNSVEEIHTGIATILDELYALIQESEKEANSQMHQRVMAYIRSHVADYDLGFDKLSSELEMSVKQLRQIIKVETGQGLREYVNALRIEQAKELLDNQGLSISDISQQVGYLSVSYFIKNFKQLTGVTPAHYRAMKMT